MAINQPLPSGYAISGFAADISLHHVSIRPRNVLTNFTRAFRSLLMSARKNRLIVPIQGHAMSMFKYSLNGYVR